MTIQEIYDNMDKCEDICAGCYIECYTPRVCAASCPVAQAMYRICAEYDRQEIIRRLAVLRFKDRLRL